jgi:hypothetical protein
MPDISPGLTGGSPFAFRCLSIQSVGHNFIYKATKPQLTLEVRPSFASKPLPEARRDPRLTPNKALERRNERLDIGDDLHGRRSGTNDSNALALELDTVIPVCAVQHRPLEGLTIGNGGPFPFAVSKSR